MSLLIKEILELTCNSLSCTSMYYDMTCVQQVSVQSFRFLGGACLRDAGFNLFTVFVYKEYLFSIPSVHVADLVISKFSAEEKKQRSVLSGILLCTLLNEQLLSTKTRMLYSSFISV